MIEKASPVDMRKALQVVHELKQHMILFVPMPVMNEQDKLELHREVERRLELYAVECKQAY